MHQLFLSVQWPIRSSRRIEVVNYSHFEAWDPSEEASPTTYKGNFPLAECNELSGKCFSHTPLGAWV